MYYFLLKLSNYIHFYWAGSVIPNKLRRNLSEWNRCLKSSCSDYQIILWLDTTSFIKTKENLEISYKEAFNESYYGQWLLKTNSSFIRINYFDKKHFFKKYPLMEEIYTIFIKNGIYVFASDIARLLIVNSFGGIYIDADIKPKYFFPTKKMLEETFLNFSDEPNLKLYPMMIDNDLENNIIFSFKSGQFDKCLLGTEKLLSYKNTRTNNYLNQERIEKQAKNYKAFHHSDENSKINKSLFMGDTFKDQLEAFNRKDAYAYSSATQKKFGNMKYEESVWSRKKKQYISQEANYFSNGVASWSTDFQFFYDQTITAYNKTFNENKASYKSFLKSNIYKLFSSSQIDMIRLNSWNDPGYTRLDNLYESKRNIINNYKSYREKQKANKTRYTHTDDHGFMSPIPIQAKMEQYCIKCCIPKKKKTVYHIGSTEPSIVYECPICKD